MFWNCEGQQIICDAPIGAMNWTVGSSGARRKGTYTDTEPDGWWESHNEPVLPRSLYLQQLADRLGQEAVEAVTTDAQRSGRIWEQLKRWAGEGRLSEF